MRLPKVAYCLSNAAMQCIGPTYTITLAMVSDVDVDVRQRVNKTFCGRDTRRLGVQTVNVHVLITVTSILNSNTCKLVELVHLWQFSPIHVFLS